MAIELDKNLAMLFKMNDVLRQTVGHTRVELTTVMDDVLFYEEADLLEIVDLFDRIYSYDCENRDELIETMREKLRTLKKKPDAPEKIYLWPKGQVPSSVEYTDNSDFKCSHDPDYEPFIFEMLVPEDVTPKGAILLCPGGDHGTSTLYDGYQVAKDMNALGYQCILLLCRPNGMPWNWIDTGADTARAFQYVRANAERLRIKPNNVAFAGFSNGGATGESVIQYFSGSKTMKDYYPDHVPDELDAFSGRPDAFLCVYGPRTERTKFDWEDVNYPPTFFAVGRLDMAMDNLERVYPDLMAHNVPVEVHTFAATPHGQAGSTLKAIRYPNFDMWEQLADWFLMDVFGIYEPVKNER